MNNNIFYDGNNIMSKNRLINFCLSIRGNGKTYFGKKIMIDNFIKYKKQSMWIRRYENEFGFFKEFLDDIKLNYPEHKPQDRKSVV